MRLVRRTTPRPIGPYRVAAILVGVAAALIAGPYTGALVGSMVSLPALLGGEFIAVPFAVGCGFAGGGLRELCPKEAIWHFSPFVFSALPPGRYTLHMQGFDNAGNASPVRQISFRVLPPWWRSVAGISVFSIDPLGTL